MRIRVRHRGLVFELANAVYLAAAGLGDKGHLVSNPCEMTHDMNILAGKVLMDEQELQPEYPMRCPAFEEAGPVRLSRRPNRNRPPLASARESGLSETSLIDLTRLRRSDHRCRNDVQTGAERISGFPSCVS